MSNKNWLNNLFISEVKPALNRYSGSGGGGGGSFKGEWADGKSYSKGDLVMCDGNLYEAKVDNPSTPRDSDMSSYWNVLYTHTNNGMDIESISVREA